MEINPVIEHYNLNVDGVVFHIKLDYKRKTVSFLDSQGNKNKFQFTDRTREYLGGWVKIFRALEKATIWADEKLDAEEKRVEGVKEKKFVDLMIAVSDLDSKKKKAKSNE